MLKVNQQLIADRLQISRATVSRCFTNHPGINPETRGRVFKLASQLGYVHMETRVPERRSRVRREISRVGVLVCADLATYFEGRIASPGEKLIAGVSEFALLEDCRLDLHYVPPGAASLSDPVYRRIPAIRSKEWVGVILVYPFPKSIVRELLPRFPLVSLVEHTGLIDVNCVDVDHYKGISMAVDELWKAGHRRIGFLTRRYDVEAGWAFRRYAAFCEKMGRLGRAIDQADLVNVAPFEFADLTESFKHAAARTRDGVTAWVCAADHLAYELIEDFAARGIDVPGRVSVTGFDGLVVPKGAPRLSTAVVPYRDIGLVGGKRLVDLIAKRFTPVQHIALAGGFRDGETIAPPWKRGARNGSHRRASA